jgi:hypothetical protein
VLFHGELSLRKSGDDRLFSITMASMSGTGDTRAGGFLETRVQLCMTVAILKGQNDWQ